MKLRRGDARTVYRTREDDIIARETMLARVRGKGVSVGKNSLKGHNKTTATTWTGRDGKPIATTFGNVVIAMDVKPADVDARRMQLLGQMRQALDSGDLAQSQRLQLEYYELMAMLDD